MREMKALRDAYGEGLVELGKEFGNLYVLDADLTKSTKTELFKKAYPDRFINCGIAEGNMMSVASGIASCGNIVFASTFAMFAAGRAYEQVRNSIAYPRANVKIVATHAGLTVGEDGATHQCLEDMALMRAVPGMVVISPSDAAQTKAALRFACAYEGPVYIRLGRTELPCIHEQYEYQPGCYSTLADGNMITLMFTGPFYDTAMKVREILHEKNISVKVMDVPSIKPFAEGAVREALADTNLIVTLEDHSTIGGLGSAVCECVAGLPVLNRISGTEVLRIGVEDRFGTSGKPAEILEKYGLDAVSVVEKIVKAKYPEFLEELCGKTHS